MKKTISRICKFITIGLCSIFIITGSGYGMFTSRAQENKDIQSLSQALTDSYYSGQDQAVFEDFKSANSQGFLNAMIRGEADVFVEPEWNYETFAKVKLLDQNLSDLQPDGALYVCTFVLNNKYGYVILNYGTENAPYIYSMNTNTPYLYDLKANLPQLCEGIQNTDIDLSTARATRVIIRNEEKQTDTQAILFTDGKEDEYIYYFQDPPSEDEKNQPENQKNQELSDIYRGFLNGTVSAVTASWYHPDDGYGTDKVENGKAYTLKQLKNVIISNIRDDQESQSIWREKFEGDTEYALFDSENDGEMELAVRLNGVGIDSYSDQDTSTATLILKETDGKLLLCDAFNTWSRSDTTQYYYGIQDSGGSCGAGDHVASVSFIDNNGKKQQIYSAETLEEDWLSMVNENALQEYNAIYNNVYPETFSIDEIIIGDKKYHTYYAVYSQDAQQREKDKEMIQTMITCFNRQGISFSTPEELQKAYDDRKQELGIKESWCKRKELDWHKISELS